MIKFFRSIRQILLSEGKSRKYLKYAIGEIVLVVIGILIALWLNNLNTQYSNKQKGHSILLEIKENLVSDSLRLNDISAYNEIKVADVNLFLTLASKKALTEAEKKESFELMSEGTLFTFEHFYKNSVGYQNLTNTGNIEFISNKELRNKLTTYYLKTELAAFEELQNLTRSFKYYIIPKILTKEYVKQSTSLDFEIQQFEDLKLYEDEKMLSDLLLLLANINHNETASLAMKKDIHQLIVLIDKETGR